MRYVIFVRANAETEAAIAPDPDPEVLAEMATYHEELARAGVLLDGTGLHPSRSGWRVHYGGDGVRVVDGPFAEAKELIAGWTLIQVRNRAEAMEWSRRFPNPMGRGREAVVEVRQLFEMDEFSPGPDIDRMLAIDTAGHGRGQSGKDTLP